MPAAALAAGQALPARREEPREEPASTRQHAADMLSSFRHSQAASYAQWDVWAGMSLTLLLLLALPNSLHRGYWRPQLVTFVAEMAFRVAPAWLATMTPSSYLPRRTPLVAACRLASLAVPRLVAKPPPSVASWSGWAQFLLFTRTLGVNALPWLARLPFKWFLWVHLLSVVDAASAALEVCASPAFTGASAQSHYAALGRGGRLLALLAPLPVAAPGLQGDVSSCVDAVIAAPRGSALPPAAGTCACHQMATWLLLCLGYALPLAAQFLAESAARRAFYRRRCRRPGCLSCAPSKGVDLPMLAVSSAAMLLGFVAVSWQLTALWFPQASVAPLSAAAAAGVQGACAAGECASGL